MIQKIINFFNKIKKPKKEIILKNIRIENIYIPITPNIFRPPNIVTCNIDAIGKEYLWREDSEYLQRVIDKIPPPNVSEEGYLYNFTRNKKYLDYLALEVKNTPIGFSHEKIYSIQHSFFANEFYNSFLFEQYWAAGMALVTIFEIQLRVILIESVCLENEAAQKKYLGQLVSEFKNAVNYEKIKIPKEKRENLIICAGKIKDSRNSYLAHNWPKDILEGITNTFPNIRNNREAILALVFHKKPTQKMWEFYKNELNNLMKEYCIFHSIMNEYYTKLFPACVTKVNQKIVSNEYIK